jgi:hypothetical protein
MEQLRNILDRLDLSPSQFQHDRRHSLHFVGFVWLHLDSFPTDADD